MSMSKSQVKKKYATNIQAAAAVNINSDDWQKFKHGPNVRIRAREVDFYNQIEQAANRNYHAAYLQKKLQKIATGEFKKESLRKDINGISVYAYPLEGGSVFIQEKDKKYYITSFGVDTYYKRNKRGENTNPPAGLYTVESIRDEWVAGKSEKFKVSNPHIAINGKMTDIDEAANAMPLLIGHAYSDFKAGASSEKYDLFYNPATHSGAYGWVDRTFGKNFTHDSRKSSMGSQQAHKLAALIHSCSKSSKKINWTIHQQGAAVFYKALRIAQENYGVKSLKGHKVFYANITISFTTIEQERKKLGMELSSAGFVQKDYSAAQGLLTGNAYWQYALMTEAGMSEGDKAVRGAMALGAFGAASAAFMFTPEVIAGAHAIVQHGVDLSLISSISSMSEAQSVVEQVLKSTGEVAGWGATMFAILSSNFLSSGDNTPVLTASDKYNALLHSLKYKKHHVLTRT